MKEEQGRPAKIRLADHFQEFLRRAYIQWMTICLGVASMTNAINYLGLADWRVPSAIFTAFIILAVFLRALYLPGTFMKELTSPAGMAAYQTGIMSVYFMCVQLLKLDAPLAHAIWTVAFACNLVLITLFLQQYVRKNFAFLALTPVWYLIFVGIGVAAITGMQMDFNRLALVVAIYAICAYTIMTPFMFIRVLGHDELHYKLQPTKAIMCAAPSVVYLGLNAAFPQVPFIAGLALFALSQGFLFWFYSNIRIFSILPFCVTFASFTFPMGISTMFLFVFRDNYFALSSIIYKGLTLVGGLEFIIACLVVLWVIWQFIVNSYWLWYGIGRRMEMQAEKE
ncbi:hypothetical protein ACKQTC_09130 [Peptococcus simiae]|uniref:Uncharacterized protein n=1 Tax=Peptococcus simiae TaxID=1643805 RepID=A0ABW9H2Z6_9FIRM